MKFLKVIYYFFLIFIVVTAFFLIFSIFPIPGNYKFFIVQSGSMEPAIKIGSVVIVKPAISYRIGDIITFNPCNQTKTPTTHRIYDIKVRAGKTIYITKGEANKTPDPRKISNREIIGRVLFSVPFVGYFVNFIKKPMGFILIIVIPATIVIYNEIRKILNLIRVKNETL